MCLRRGCLSKSFPPSNQQLGCLGGRFLAVESHGSLTPEEEGPGPAARQLPALFFYFTTSSRRFLSLSSSQTFSSLLSCFEYLDPLHHRSQSHLSHFSFLVTITPKVRRLVAISPAIPLPPLARCPLVLDDWDGLFALGNWPSFEMYPSFTLS